MGRTDKLPDCTRCHRTGNFTFEKRWPKRLLHLAPGAKFRLSLGTSDIEHALPKRMAARASYDRQVAALERRLTGGPVERPAPPVSSRTIISAIEHWRELERRHRFERVTRRGFDAEDADAFDAEVRLAGACGTQPHALSDEHEEWSDANYEAVEQLADRIRKRSGFELTSRDDAYWLMAKMVSDAWKIVLEDEFRWRRFDIVNPPVGDAPAFAPSRRLSEVYERFLKEKQYAKTIEREHRTAFNRFGEVLGSDLGMREITRQHVSEFKQLCFELPVSRTREQSEMPMLKLVHSLKDQSVERLDIETVRKHVGFLQTFFGWAVSQGEIDVNVAQGLKPAIPRSRGRMRTKNRAPMSAEDVKLFFESPLFTGVKSPHRLFQNGDHLIWDERFWIPILAAFTGASTSEIAWLQHKDIREEGGFCWLNITSISDHEDDEEERSLKAEARHRDLPLHPKIIEIGFLEYAKTIPLSRKRIFYRLKPDAEGRISKVFSQNMSRYLRRIGITEKRKVFYSLRHTFKDALRNQAKVESYIQDALMGHAEKGSGKGYGGGVDIPVLADAIGRVEIPGFPETMRRFRPSRLPPRA